MARIRTILRPELSTLIASAVFVVGVLYVHIAIGRLGTIWSPEQQLLLATSLGNLGHHQDITIYSKNQKDVSVDNSDSNSNDGVPSPCWNQTPPIWPRQMVVTQKRVPDSDSRVGPATTITYYDYDRGGNLIKDIPNDKNKAVLWDLELNTGHSYYFYPSKQTCKPVDMPVGILRPDWLEGATPTGPSMTTWRRKYDVTNENGETMTDRLVCGWTKMDFIDYYTDASTGRPDSWYFHTMKANFYVLNYTQVGDPSWSNNTIDPALFVPPDYCLK